MKDSIALIRKLQADETLAEMSKDNNRMLLLLCEKLGIDPTAEPGSLNILPADPPKAKK